MNNRRFLCVMALLLLQAGIYYTMSAKEFIPDIAPWSRFPAEIGSWRGVGDEPLDEDVLTELKPDDYLNRSYVSGNRELSLFVGYFNSRRNGRAPHSPEWCLPGAGWNPISTRTVSIDLGSGRLPASEYIVEKKPERLLVLYWYHQGERVTSSETMAQLYAIPDMLMHGRTDTSLVRIIAPIAGNQTESARDLAFGFAREIYPLIRSQIR